MCSYPQLETVVTRLDDGFVVIIWPHGNPVRFYQYRVNRLVLVRGEVVETELVGRGTAPTLGEAQTAAEEVHRLVLAKVYAVD